MNDTSATGANRLRVLDGLRGCAILQVLWYHLWQLSWHSPNVAIGGAVVPFEIVPITGYFGVELFFFLSGFCLFLPYLRRRQATGAAPSLKVFARKRAAKILPSYFLALGLASLWVWKSTDAWALARQIVAHLFFVHNLSPSTYGSLIGVLWSLAVEAQFYLLFPMIAAAFWRRPVTTWCFGTALAVLYRAWILSSDVSRAFAGNQLPGVLDLFLMGMLTARVVALPPKLPSWHRKLGGAVAAFGVLAVGLLLAMAYVGRYDPAGEITWQLKYRLAMALSYGVVTWGFLHAPPALQAVVTNAPLRFAGLISYNLYIWHQEIARWLFESRWPQPITANPHDDPQWQWRYSLVAFLLMLGWATVLTYFVERPVVSWAAKKSD